MRGHIMLNTHSDFLLIDCVILDDIWHLTATGPMLASIGPAVAQRSMLSRGVACMWLVCYSYNCDTSTIKALFYLVALVGCGVCLCACMWVCVCVSMYVVVLWKQL